MVQRLVLATDEKPFSDRDAAQLKLELLSEQLGAAVELQIVDHEGGLAIAVNGRAAKTLPSKKPAGTAKAKSILAGAALLPAGRDQAAALDLGARYPVPPPPSVESNAAASESRPPEEPVTRERRAESSYPERFSLSPAPRAFITQHLLSIVGLACVLKPHTVFDWLLHALPLAPHLQRFGVALVMLAGFVVLLLSLSRFLATYLSNSYEVDANGVRQVQWYRARLLLRRRESKVLFDRLRMVDVDQGLLQMLLNVGTVRLASGATDEYEVILKDVSAPRRLQAEFQRRAPQTSPNNS